MSLMTNKFAIASVVMTLSATGCLRGTSYVCSEDNQCGPGNKCEKTTGYCSFADSDCQRYSDSAGPYAGQCVGSVMNDANTNTDGSIDAPIDAPVVGCPNGYNPLPGIANGHLYRLLTATDPWSAQRTACIATTTSAYLAIPDDDPEIMALSTLAAGNYWVGISDQATEGQYMNVKNAAQMFLPWAPMEPNQGPADGDCVMSNATAKILDDKCGAQYRAICECEP